MASLSSFPNSKNNSVIENTPIKPQSQIKKLICAIFKIALLIAFCSVCIYVCFACFYLIFYVIFMNLLGFPDVVTFSPSNASLGDFSLTSNNQTLRYNITFMLATNNPNYYVGFDYNSVKVTAYYEKQELGTVSFPAFFHDKRSEITFDPIILHGEAKGINQEKFLQHKNEGAFLFEVGVDLVQTRYKSLQTSIVSRKFDHDVHCQMKIAVGNGTGIYRGYMCSDGPDVSLSKWLF